LLPFIRRYRAQKFIFQADNASVHVSSSTKEWLLKHSVHALNWQACYPDLNPKENIWAVLVRENYANGRQFCSISDLKSAIMEAWETIDSRIIKNLSDSVQNRLFELVQIGGAMASY
jgi:hypothetical protein